MSRASARLARTKDSGFELAPRGSADPAAYHARLLERMYPTLLAMDPAALAQRCAASVNADPADGPTAFLRRYGPYLLRDFRPSRLTASPVLCLPTSQLEYPPEVGPRSLPVNNDWLSRLADAELATRQYREPIGSRFVHNRPQTISTFFVQVSHSVEVFRDALGQFAATVTTFAEGVSEYLSRFTVYWPDGVEVPGPIELRRTVNPAWAAGQADRTRRALAQANLQSQADGIMQNVVIGRPGWSNESSGYSHGHSVEVEGRQEYEDRIDAQRVRMQVEREAQYWNAPGYLSEDLHEAIPQGYELSGDPTPTGKGDPLAGVLGGMDRLLAQMDELIGND